jgi:thiol-disulfide isomerase/thioredoxin
MGPTLLACLAALWLFFWPAGSALAGIPAAYAPVVIEATGLPERHEFDLTAALQRARTENKQLYVYLGATDCPFCRRYELFLAHNAQVLASVFTARYLVVDLRSSLRVPSSQVFIRIADQSLAYLDFQQHIGDRRARALVYPNVWLLDQQARPLMQMPIGTGTFETVAEQLDVLRLEP